MSGFQGEVWLTAQVAHMRKLCDSVYHDMWFLRPRFTVLRLSRL